MNEKDTGISWLKKHADTIIILGTFAGAFWTLNEKMNDKFLNMSSDINAKVTLTNEKIGSIEKDIAIIKTVLIIKNIMPDELCQNLKEEKKVKE